MSDQSFQNKEEFKKLLDEAFEKKRKEGGWNHRSSNAERNNSSDSKNNEMKRLENEWNRDFNRITQETNAKRNRPYIRELRKTPGIHQWVCNDLDLMLKELEKYEDVEDETISKERLCMLRNNLLKSMHETENEIRDSLNKDVKNFKLDCIQANKKERFNEENIVNTAKNLEYGFKKYYGKNLPLLQEFLVTAELGQFTLQHNFTIPLILELKKALDEINGDCYWFKPVVENDKPDTLIVAGDGSVNVAATVGVEKNRTIAEQLGVQAWHELEAEFHVDGLRWKKKGSKKAVPLNRTWGDMGIDKAKILQRIMGELAVSKAEGIVNPGTTAHRKNVERLNKMLRNSVGLNTNPISNKGGIRTQCNFTITESGMVGEMRPKKGMVSIDSKIGTAATSKHKAGEWAQKQHSGK